MWGLGIKLSLLGWSQASLPDEPSHLVESHFFFQPEDEYLYPELQDEAQQAWSKEICSVVTVPTNLILQAFLVTEPNTLSSALTHLLGFPCCGFSAEVLVTPV